MLFHIKFIIQSYTSLVKGSVLLGCLLKYMGYLIKSHSNPGWSILCSIWKNCSIIIIMIIMIILRTKTYRKANLPHKTKEKGMASSVIGVFHGPSSSQQSYDRNVSLQICVMALHNALL